MCKIDFKIVMCVCLILFTVINVSVSAVEPANTYTNWDELKRRYDDFLKKQSEENKEALYNVLPSKRLDWKKYEPNTKVLNYILGNFSPVEKLVEKGDLWILRILFRLQILLDGANSEYIHYLAGTAITSNPENFLTALEEHLDVQNNVSYFMSNLGPDYVDKFGKQADEFLRRYIAVNNVEVKNNDNISLTTKKLCLYHLGKRLTGSNGMYFLVNKKKELLDK